MAKRKPDGPLSVAERNAVVEAFLAAYPRPSLLLGKRYSGMVRRAVYHRCDRDDIHSACLLGLMKAARLYRPEWGDFRPIAVQYMWSEVGELTRRLDVDLQHRGGRQLEAELSDPLDSFQGGVWEAELREAVTAAPGGHLLAQRYGIEGTPKRTVAEIAAEHGIHPDTVWDRLRRAKRWLRAIYCR